MKFGQWKKGKEDEQVSCCVINEPDGSPYVDFLGKVSALPAKFDSYEVLDPIKCKTKDCWVIDLALVF